MKRTHLSMAVTIALLVFSVLDVTAADNINSISPMTAVIPPPTNPQTSNATLGYDLANRLKEDSSTCTYEWGPMLVVYQKGDTAIINYSATSPIDAYLFSSNSYEGKISCTLGPILRVRQGTAAYTGEHYLFIVAAPGSFYVLFINHAPMVTPHVTLETTVSLHPTTTTTTISPPSSAIPFMGVSVVLIALLLTLFLVARRSAWRRNDGEKNRGDSSS